MLAACGSDDDSGGRAAAVAVTDGLGNDVDIPAEPSRIFGMYTTDLDYVLALGLEVAPTQAIRRGSVGLPDFFPEDEVADLEFFENYPEYNFEAIAAVEPDLIVNGLGFDDGPAIDRLSAIAPTYSFNGFAGDWRDDFTALAKALGREDQAEDVLAEIDGRTAEVRAAVEALVEPPVMAYGYYYGDGTGGFYGPQLDQLQPIVFNDVGAKTTSAATEGWTEVSQENIGMLADVDILMIAVETSEDPDAILAQLDDDPLWSDLPAVKAGHVVTVNNELSYASPSAHLAFLDVLEDAIARLGAAR